MSESCGDPATRIVNWPGRLPLAMCEYHASACTRVSQAMGFYLHVEVIDGDRTCQSKDPNAIERAGEPGPETK